MRFALPIVAGCSLLAAPAFGQSAADPGAQQRRAAAMQFIYSTMGYRAGSIEAVLRRGRIRFERLDVDGGGYGESDIRLARERIRARNVARRLSVWLANDLNGDGQITRAEVERAMMARARQPLRSAAGQVMPTKEQIAELLDGLMRQNMPMDPDGDGVVTIVEMLKQARTYPYTGRSRLRLSSRIRRAVRARLIPVAFDANRDGVVTWREIEREVRPILREYDRDQDGELSLAEMRQLRNNAYRSRRSARLRTRPAFTRTLARDKRNCRLTRAREGMVLIAARIFSGKAVPTVSLGGDNVVTGLADLVIEDGKKPVYLVVASAAPMVLRLSGATDRLQRIVAIGPFVAFTGIDRARVTWTRRGQCGVPTWNPRSHRRNDWREIVAAGAGRKPDREIVVWNAGRISLPSGQEIGNGALPGAVRPDLSGPAGPIWKAFTVFAPGGLVHLRANRIVTATTARRYTVFPHLAGLATLVESGALAIEDAGKISQVKSPGRSGCMRLGRHDICVSTRTMMYTVGRDVFRSGTGGVMVAGRLPTFTIKGKLRLPPGMRGAQAAIFQLPAGAPRPDGWLGDSRLVVKR